MLREFRVLAAVTTWSSLVPARPRHQIAKRRRALMKLWDIHTQAHQFSAQALQICRSLLV